MRFPPGRVVEPGEEEGGRHRHVLVHRDAPGADAEDRRQQVPGGDGHLPPALVPGAHAALLRALELRGTSRGRQAFCLGEAFLKSQDIL
jgi:hypothetical protein